MKNFNVKSFVAGIILCAMAFTFFSVYAESVAQTIEVMYEDIRVMVEGKEVKPVNSAGKPAEPFTYNGVVYLPVTALNGLSEYNVKTDEENSTVSFYKKTPDVKLTDLRSIEDYLIENYSVIKTSQGNCRLEFTVFERIVKSDPYDYNIKVKMDGYFYSRNISTSSMMSSNQLETVRSEVKAHMSTMANDLIQKLPGKKLQGRYDQSFEVELTKKKKQIYIIQINKWTNYPYTLNDSYDKAKATEEIVWQGSTEFNYTSTN